MTPKTIPDAILHSPVDGLNLTPGTLADQIDAAGPTLLVFLRHYG